ncbi:methyl-accepting chemotaxis protein [Aquabacter cavernae]|uniref:methyl-accepting chemotaxis protein n=1 Tax=Aquabacter cavernae TaxID=2496029 RepID=UPI0013DFBE91|nr:methyl-accepting chemotaxis protein [Aquabacter cavernae]
MDTKLIERLPTCVLVCDPQSLVILYVNRRAQAAFADMAQALPVAPGAMVGAALADLHPDFAAIARALSKREGLPLQRRIDLSGHALQVELDVMEAGRGHQGYALVTFAPTEPVLSATARRLRQMVDDMPVNVMTCTLGDFLIDYANKASIETLRRIERYLPITADQLIGSSIDVFHKMPGRVREILADPRNLPHNARIKAGPETLDLRITAITDETGAYMGPMLTWTWMTQSVALADGVTQVVSAMSSTADRVQSSSERLLSLAEHSEQMVSAVSASAVEMSASFDEVSDQLRRATDMSRDMAHKAGATDELVNGLAGSVDRIGTVTALIEKIASQTNLLALNATIEAARVGEAGRGFAVVAQEVKALAVQTAAATKDIRDQVTAVQQTSAAAAASVTDITGNIGRLSEVFTAISSGMEEQSVSNRGVSASVTGVSRAVSEIREAAHGVSTVAGEVSAFADRLTRETQVLLNRKD